MAGTPRVQLSLKGRLLSEVAFAGPQLRIGRMRENDVVVNNLAVSRFHATLRREGEGFVLEDLGSENGTQLNGERVNGSISIKPSDVIQLGKYELRLVTQPGLQIAGAPKPKPSDAWDASQTFLALGPLPAGASKPMSPPAARAIEKAPEPEPELAILEDAELLSDAPEESAPPDPDGVFAFGESDLGAAEEPGAAVEAGTEFETDPFPARNPEHTSLFDFGAPASPEPAAAAPMPPPHPNTPVAAKPHEPRLHAGLIVQRDGKLHLLRPWEAGELCAGRAPECEIVLADAGVSRRHAVFSCGPEGHGVRDLESVNGIYVNGQRTTQHLLTVGDVVRIESFELTFVLDHQPIGSEVSGPKPVPASDHELGRATQFSLEAPAREDEDAFELTSLAGDPNEPPDATNDAAQPAQLDEITDGFEVLPPADDPYDGEAQPAEIPLELSLPESDLVSDAGIDDGEDEKESTVQGLLLTPAAESVSACAPVSLDGLQLRLVVDAAQLSPRAREALAVLAEEGVAISAQLRIERDAR